MTDPACHKTATGSNLIALDGPEPLLGYGGHLVQQAAAYGDRGLAMVARMRPMARLMFSYLEGSGRLARADVRTALEATVASGDLIDALCQLSPIRLLKVAYLGRVPQHALSVITIGTSENGLSPDEAQLLHHWFERGSQADVERVRLLHEAVLALRSRRGMDVRVNLGRVLMTFSDLPDRYLELISFRDVRTVDDVLLTYFGVTQLTYTLEHVERVCGPQALDAYALQQKQRLGQPLSSLLRALLEEQGLYLPKPVFAEELGLKALTPREALDLSLLWQNCIRNTWMDKMLTGDLAFVLSDALNLVAMLHRL